MNIKLNVDSLGDPISFGSGQVQYKFGTRRTDTVLNLRDGETVIIGGMISDEERKRKVKIPLLGDIPVLGQLFSYSSDDARKTDILLSITPNIVRAVEIPEKDIQSFWSGTEEGYDVKPLFVTAAGKSSKPGEKTLSKAAVLDTMAKREKPPAAPEAAQPAPEAAKPAGPPAAAERPVAPTAAAVIQVKPAEATTQVGQDARVELAIDNVQGLYGAIITLAYDPKVMEFKTASEGQFLNKDGQQTSFLFSNNVKAGTVDLYLTRIGDVGGVDGAGTLCTLVFQGKAGGSSDLVIRSAKIGNHDREQLKTDLRGGKVVVK
jgi:general secretion pathway protein D